ncbi:hypothetical protein [Phenylobacterium sp.]|uniref:hypothetical protein n=1 Tax=Phenylobacterium sp. TaxID=1871053 RepID=UPI003561E54C
MEPTPEGDPPVRPYDRRYWLIGPALALAYALVLYGLVHWFRPDSGTVVISFVIGAPLGACLIAVRLDDPHGRGGAWRHIFMSALVISWMLLVSFAILREGSLCVMMAAPLFYAVGIAGGLLGGMLARGSVGRTLCLAIIAAPLVGIPVEPQDAYPRVTEQVTSVIDIAAPPEVVWRRTVAIPAIAPAERIATFSHNVVGVPRPVSARLDGQGPGAVRQLAWTGGVHFQEVITHWDQDRSLAWRFRFAPDSVPLAIERNINVQSGYLWLSDGDYRLDPLPNGSTRLTLTTRYRLRTPINAYCAWWGGVFFNDFHRAVLHVIKLRAEGAAGRA